MGVVGGHKAGERGDFAGLGEALTEAVEERQIREEQTETEQAVGKRMEAEGSEHEAVDEGAEGSIVVEEIGGRGGPRHIEVHHVVGREIGTEAISGEGEEEGADGQGREDGGAAGWLASLAGLGMGVRGWGFVPGFARLVGLAAAVWWKHEELL